MGTAASYLQRMVPIKERNTKTDWKVSITSTVTLRLKKQEFLSNDDNMTLSKKGVKVLAVFLVLISGFRHCVLPTVSALLITSIYWNRRDLYKRE